MDEVRGGGKLKVDRKQLESSTYSHLNCLSHSRVGTGLLTPKRERQQVESLDVFKGVGVCDVIGQLMRGTNRPQRNRSR